MRLPLGGNSVGVSGVSRPIRIVQAGVGDFGTRWLSVLERCPGVELVGVVSRSAARRMAAAAAANLPEQAAFAALGPALDRCRPDLVLLVTPPDAHRDGALEAIRRGIPVLCEKPAADRWEDAVDMANAAREAGVELAVGENYRFQPAMRAARSLLEQDAIGAVRAVEIRFARSHQTGNYHMALQEPLLLDVAVHHFDCLRYLTGQEVRSAAAAYSAVQGSPYRGNAACAAQLCMTGGITARYDGTLCAACGETPWHADWDIHGSRGTLSIRRGAVYQTGGPAIRCDPEDDGMAALLEDVLAALRASRAPETALSDNLRSLGVSMMVIEAAGTGMGVSAMEEGTNSEKL